MSHILDAMNEEILPDLLELIDMAQNALDQKQYEMALELCEEYLEVCPLDADAINLCAVAAAHLDDLFKAETLYCNALRLDPNNGSVCHNYGVLLERRGDYLKAEQLFRRSLALQPDFPEAYVNLGNTLDEQGRSEEALDLYQQALRRLPENTDVYFNLGYVLNRLGRFDEALANFAEVLRQHQEDAGAWNGRGYALAGLKRHEEALEAYEQALALAPDNGTYHYNRGLTYSAMRRRQDAFDDYEQATVFDPGLTEAWFELINLLIENDRLKEARKAISHVQGLAPNSPEPSFYRGMLLSRQHRFDEAIAMMDQALELDGSCYHALNNKGNMLLDLGRLDEAEVCFKRLLTLKADYALAHYNLACIHARRSQLSSSVAALKRALLLDPALKKDISDDRDFDAIRQEPLFVHLVAGAEDSSL